ncbi:hypothetical protein Q7P37_009780 [Cladosporium fusiforme]
MYLQTVMVLCLSTSAIAERSEIRGLNTIVTVLPLASTSKVANDVYSVCREFEDGLVVSEGEICVGEALSYMTQALVDMNAEVATALLSNTVDTIQPAQNNKSNAKLLLQRRRSRLLRRSEGKHGIRTVEYNSSELHPKDGTALRMNIRSTDSDLHVQTKGSRMTATFKRDSSSAVGHRDIPIAQNTGFGFEGAQGLKIQLRWKEPRESPSELNVLFPIIAYSNWLNASDSWAFVECDAVQREIILQGKLIWQDDGAGDNLESDGLIGCT